MTMPPEWVAKTKGSTFVALLNRYINRRLFLVLLLLSFPIFSCASSEEVSKGHCFSVWELLCLGEVKWNPVSLRSFVYVLLASGRKSNLGLFFLQFLTSPTLSTVVLDPTGSEKARLPFYIKSFSVGWASKGEKTTAVFFLLLGRIHLDLTWHMEPFRDEGIITYLEFYGV